MKMQLILLVFLKYLILEEEMDRDIFDLVDGEKYQANSLM